MLFEKKLNHSLKITTYLVLSLSFTLIQLFGLLSLNLKSILTKWGNESQIILYLSNETNHETRELIEEKIKQEPSVESVQFVSKEKALSEFQTQLAGFSGDLEKDDIIADLLPNALHVTIKKNFAEIETQLFDIKALSQKFKSFVGVDDVQFGESWLKEYLGITRAAYGIIFFVMAILLLSSAFIVSNLMRALIDAKRSEIEVFEMIGATYWKIRKPFLIRAIFIGFFSSALAILFTYFISTYLKNLLNNSFHLDHLTKSFSFFNVFQISVLLILGAAISFLATYLSVKKINTGWASRGT